jgi:nucleotide-binding universal stress UspA family protein
MTRSIVVGYDGSAGGRAAVDKAIAIAREGSGWEIVLVCTHERPADFRGHQSLYFRPRFIQDVPPQAWIDEWSTRVSKDMDHIVQRVRLAGIDASATCTLDDPAELIEQVARDVKARFIVVADDQGSALHDLLLGSLTKQLLHRCEAPVVVVHAEGERRSA